MSKKILCMGSINIDLVMYMDHLPQDGETVLTDNFQTFPGGKGGNQAAAAAILGGSVKYFTKLGGDAFSDQLIEEQKKCGVDVSPILRDPNSTAGIAMIRVNSAGQNSISFTSGANSLLTPEDVRNNESVFDDCDVLLITMEINTETVYEAIRVAKSKGLTVILDPAPAPAKGIPNEIAELVDYVKPNETETELLTGIHIDSHETALEALKLLKEKGFHTPIITLGEAGALTSINDKPCMIEPISVKSVDSTAAGDIFLGSFASSLVRGEKFERCLEFAKKSAAISTTRKGAQSSIPTVKEVADYVSN